MLRPNKVNDNSAFICIRGDLSIVNLDNTHRLSTRNRDRFQLDFHFNVGRQDHKDDTQTQHKQEIMDSTPFVIVVISSLNLVFLNLLVGMNLYV